MKKVLPFVFPLVALLIVVFLAYRWYNLNTTRSGQIADNSEGVEIQDLTESERNNIMRGVGDFKSVELKGDPQTRGDVRYEIQDGKVVFSVSADLPFLSSGRYQVWVKSDDKPAQKMFNLEESKGGYIGTGGVSEASLPFSVIVTQEQTDDLTMESVVLEGMVQK